MARQLFLSTFGLALLALAFLGFDLLSKTSAHAGAEKPQKENSSMLSSSPVVAMVATKDPVKAKAFYQDVLKLKLTADDPFALVFDANGTTLRVSKVKEVTVAPYTVLGWKVSDIGAVMKELTGRGVAFEKYKSFPQDEAGLCTLQDGTKLAWFKDPDGNTLSVTQLPKK